MKCFQLFAVAALVLCLAASTRASDSTIGVFFDLGADDCDFSISPYPPYSPFDVYVSAVLGTDAAGAGITGAEFRVDGLAGIVVSVTPNASSVLAIGDPTAGSSIIAFQLCMVGGGPRDVVPLYTITCLASYPVVPRTVRVNASAIPCDSCFPCRLAPCLVLCDHPVYTKMLVSGGQALINNGACSVALQPTTWSAVKAIFADH
jgi:hypothetical protein